MAVPDFQTMMNYVLDICANSNCEIGQRQIESEIAKRLNLSEEDQNFNEEE